jgi:hypothetical protein
MSFLEAETRGSRQATDHSVDSDTLVLDDLVGKGSSKGNDGYTMVFVRARDHLWHGPSNSHSPPLVEV